MSNGRKISPEGSSGCHERNNMWGRQRWLVDDKMHHRFSPKNVKAIKYCQFRPASWDIRCCTYFAPNVDRMMATFRRWNYTEYRIQEKACGTAVRGSKLSGTIENLTLGTGGVVHSDCCVPRRCYPVGVELTAISRLSRNIGRSQECTAKTRSGQMTSGKLTSGKLTQSPLTSGFVWGERRDGAVYHSRNIKWSTSEY
jgi:hypothetical protein